MRLEPFECHLAGLVGLQRQVESVFSERRPQFPERYANEMFATHVVGAMAEFAVAKELGLEWDGHVNHFSKPDLVARKGSGRIWIEVRYTPTRRDIKVKDSDPDHALVVGVCGEPPDFEMLGFVKAGTIKAEDSLLKAPAPGKPAWFADYEWIQSVEVLKEWLSA